MSRIEVQAKPGDLNDRVIFIIGDLRFTAQIQGLAVIIQKTSDGIQEKMIVEPNSSNTITVK